MRRTHALIASVAFGFLPSACTEEAKNLCHGDLAAVTRDGDTCEKRLNSDMAKLCDKTTGATAARVYLGKCGDTQFVHAHWALGWEVWYCDPSGKVIGFALQSDVLDETCWGQHSYGMIPGCSIQERESGPTFCEYDKSAKLTGDAIGDGNSETAP